MAQVTIDFSKHGAKEGFIKAVKVIGYHVIANVVVVGGILGTQALHGASLHYPEYAGVITSLIASVNAIIVLAQKWLSTNPVSVAEQPTPVVEETPAIG